MYDGVIGSIITTATSIVLGLVGILMFTALALQKDTSEESSLKVLTFCGLLVIIDTLLMCVGKLLA